MKPTEQTPNRSGFLLEDVAASCGCEYLSDLHFSDHSRMLPILLQRVSWAQDSLKDWTEAIEYIFGARIPFPSHESVHRFFTEREEMNESKENYL